MIPFYVWTAAAASGFAGTLLVLGSSMERRSRRSRYRHANALGLPPQKRRAQASASPSHQAIPAVSTTPQLQRNMETNPSPPCSSNRQQSDEPNQSIAAAESTRGHTISATEANARASSRVDSRAGQGGDTDTFAHRSRSLHAEDVPIPSANPGGDQGEAADEHGEIVYELTSGDADANEDDVAVEPDAEHGFQQNPEQNSDDPGEERDADANEDDAAFGPDPEQGFEQNPEQGSDDPGEEGNLVDASHWDWRVIWAIIMMTGTKKVTRLQYQSIRSLASSLTSSLLEQTPENGGSYIPSAAVRSIGRFPHYCTIHKGFRPLIYKRLAPRFESVRMPVDLRKRGARGVPASSGDHPSIDVMVVPPSEFARADLATPSVFDVMYRHSLAGARENENSPTFSPTPSFPCADTSPIVVNREWFYGQPKRISVDSTEGSDPYLFADVGDCIRLQILGATELTSEVKLCFSVADSSCSGLRQLEGTIVHTWTVGFNLDPMHLQTNLSATPLSPPDNRIVTELSVSNYKSPADAASSDLRKSEWRAWNKPYLKPGDFVALLKPTEGRDSSMCSELRDERLCVVSRFWVERTERSRHVFTVQSLATATHSCPEGTNSSSSDVVDVVHIDLVRRSNSKTSLHMTKPISSFGTLQNGEDYFVYRFLVYWDGFNFLTDKQDAGEGFYMLPLNIPPKDRSSQHAVRALCVTPPGVSAEPVLDHVLSDISVGATTGFVDYDANGHRRRIFLDFVGVLGDTPAINSCLDVKGHTAMAPCHQCSTVRIAASRFGSRFTARYCKGSTSASRRTISRHDALRSATGVENCRLLGIHHNTSSMQRSLYRYSQKLSSVFSSVPREREGERVISPVFDPYRGSLIAPDHVFSGLLKCALNLAIQFLPSPESRLTVEARILCYLKECGLPRQNKLLDGERGRILNMSMTHMYAVGIVSPFAFTSGIVHASLPQHAKDAIRVLNLLLAVIRDLSWAPVKDRDPLSSFQQFDAENGMTRITAVRKRVEIYLKAVEELCKMPDDEALRLEQRTGTAAQIRELRQKEKICKDAMHSLDRPNTHRLLELVDMTLQMMGRLDIIAELALEKRHQVMKRAIQKSNFKQPHDHALKCSLINDWQGRLTLSVKQARSGDARARLACFRLLSGREAIAQFGGSPPQHVLDSGLNSLNGADCLQAELEAQSISVLSSTDSSSLFPRLSHKRAHSSSTVPGASRALLQQAIHISSQSPIRDIIQLKRVTLQQRPHSTLHHIESNSVLRVLQLPQSASDATPRVVRTPPDGRFSSDNLISANVYFWCVRRLFQVTLLSDERQYYGEVVPVRTCSGTPQMVLATYSVSPSASSSIICLHPTVQITATLHNCDLYGCTVSTDRATITHSPAAARLEGDEFYILSSETGFPPRAG